MLLSALGRFDSQAILDIFLLSVFLILLFVFFFLFLILLCQELGGRAQHDDRGADPLHLVELVAESEVREHDREELPRGRDYTQEVAVEDADAEEDAHLADGAGQADHDAVEEQLLVTEYAPVGIISLREDAKEVDRSAQHEADHVVHKHSGVGKVSLCLLVLLVGLRPCQPVEGEAAQEKNEAERVGARIISF